MRAKIKKIFFVFSTFLFVFLCGREIYAKAKVTEMICKSKIIDVGGNNQTIRISENNSTIEIAPEGSFFHLISRWEYGCWDYLQPRVSPTSSIRSYQAEFCSSFPTMNNTSSGYKKCEEMIIAVKPNLTGKPIEFCISYKNETVYFHQNPVRFELNDYDAIDCCYTNRKKVIDILDSFAHYFGSLSDVGHERGALYAKLAVETFWEKNVNYQYAAYDQYEAIMDERNVWRSKQKLDCWRLIACANKRYAMSLRDSGVTNFDKVFNISYFGSKNILNYSVTNCVGYNEGKTSTPQGVPTWYTSVCEPMGSHYVDKLSRFNSKKIKENYWSRAFFDEEIGKYLSTDGRDGYYIYPGTYIFTNYINETPDVIGHIGIYLFAYNDGSKTYPLVFDTTGSKNQNGEPVALIDHEPIPNTYDNKPYHEGTKYNNYQDAYPHIQTQIQPRVNALAFPFVCNPRFEGMGKLELGYY